ncbi:hypothetical protein NM208_g11126 [Fusarium decemcellulare]|uniref:Uncharacterized protein n=1 Tax=Fusarium decemcellulare TaxID=57161 RepID=A0ACC1RVE9_9HYPO|nr:hypothetical protein NM208_g11126 [Fusarium decemcellulare]
MKPQSAKKQEGREEPSSHANIFKPRTPREPETETTKDAYSGQPSNPSTALVDNFDLEDEPSASQNPGNQYSPPPATTIDGGTRCSPQDSIHFVATQSQKALKQNTESSDYLENSCPEYLRGPSDSAGAPQQDLGQGQIAPSRPPPSLVSSQSRLVALASSQEVASPDSPPLVDSNKHTATGSTADEPKLITDIAPSQMFPSVTIIGKSAVSMKPDGNCLFYALADQICQDPNQADNIREAIITFMADNRDVFKTMLPLNDIHPSQGQEDSFDWNENVRLERYLLLLAKKGVWGGEPEIFAAAQHFGVTITVHQENGKFLKYNEYSGDDTVHIRYSRQHNHYYSVKGNDEVHHDNSNAATNLADFESDSSGNNDTTSSHVVEFQPSIEHFTHSELSGMAEDRSHWPAAQSKRLFQMKESGCSWKEIQAAIPHRTLGACQKHWDVVKRMTKEARQAWWEKRAVAPSRKAPRKWTTTEDELLLQLRDAGCTWSTILEVLPGRTPSAVQHRWSLKRKNRHVEAVDSTSAVRRAPKKRSVTFVEESIPAPLPKVQSTRVVQEMSKAEVIIELESGAATFPRVGSRIMNIKTKAPSSLDSAFAPARRNAHEQHVIRKGVSSARWSLSDEQLLSKMKVAGHSWIDISKALPNNRTERAVSSHWNEMQKGNLGPKRGWSRYDDQRLTQMKEPGKWPECLKSIGVTLASLNPNPHVRLVHARKKIITQRRVQTRWRHAMRHPNLTAYRKTVDAMNESNIKLRLQDRLKNMDEIDKKGSIEQKKRCLEGFLAHGQKGILPGFYSVARKDGIRYPGDGGPDPQVETDHESVEGEADELPTEAQISRPKRGRHLERRRQNKTNSRTFIDLKELGAALGRQWPIYPGFQIVIDQLQKVRDGSDAEVSLLTLDTEFISTSRRILEVAVGELHSGKVLLGAKVDHQCTTEELLKKPDGRPMSIAAQRISFESLRKVYGPHGQEKCSGKETAREIAETLQKAGVTHTSIILVWHVNTFDLIILKELLESAGYRHILPPKENCIPMIKHYRAGLPARDKFDRPFSVKLDHLFPILFAEHQLVGTNHNAVPDIQMLRLMVLLLVQLQKPPSERDLTEFPTTTQEFVGSANPPYTFLERWLGLSQPHLGNEGNEEEDGSDGEEEEDDDDGCVEEGDDEEYDGDGDCDKAEGDDDSDREEDDSECHIPDQGNAQNLHHRRSHGLRFTFQGNEVELDEGLKEASVKEVTGSSVATVLAAGLAALISIARAKFKEIKKHDGMMTALKDIGTTEESNHKFIQVWDVFGPKVLEKEGVDPEEWIHLISEVGELLCRKIR